MEALVGLDDEVPDYAMTAGNCSIIICSGAALNPYGHAILCYDRERALFAHINTPGKHTPSLLVGMDALKAYVEGEGQKIVGEVIFDDIQDAEAARAYLYEHLYKGYFWGGTQHNCLTWACKMAEAGGSQKLPSHEGDPIKFLHEHGQGLRVAPDKRWKRWLQPWKKPPGNA